MKKPITLKKLQKYVKKKDFKPKQKKKYFMKLIEEVGELAEMVKKDRRLEEDATSIKGTLEEELADVLFYVIAIANVYDIDIEESFLMKERHSSKKK
jgi:NTP pyrophosphatase (non-canonical NTP hydrolase)